MGLSTIKYRFQRVSFVSFPVYVKNQKKSGNRISHHHQKKKNRNQNGKSRDQK